MIIAYHMSVHDDDTYMLGPDTYRMPPEAGFYDWRFGKDGVPHPATCPTCGRKIDLNYINPAFRVTKRRRDLTATYDGYVLVSDRFRDFCETNNWHQHVQFAPLPSDDDFFVFKPQRTLEFDADRRGTRFEDYCPECNKHFSVVGATPVYLRNVTAAISDDIYRSDLEFASGHEQHPLLILGVATAQAIKAAGFQKIDLTPIQG